MTRAAPDPAAAESLAAAFRADPNRAFSREEAAILAAAAGTDLWAAKAAALHYFKARDFERAAALMRGVAEREPNPENIRNVAVALRSLGRFEEAVAWVESRRAGFDPIELHDLLCSLLVRLGRIGEAVAHGGEALRLKDAAAPAAPLPAPIVRPFDLGARGRNVIAFSVWGTDPRYLNGAVTNAIVARYLYPGWTARFYTDAGTPEGFRGALAQHGAQVVLVDDLPAERFGLFWRFLVEDDESVDLYLVRDADSVINVKERWAVADWLGAGTAFHVMRDHPQHSELILAGMWGAHRGNIGGMRARIEACVAGGAKVANNVTLDQHFLRDAIWPIARGSVTIHDAYFDFMRPRRFDPAFALPRPIHIGQDDWVNFRQS